MTTEEYKDKEGDQEPERQAERQAGEVEQKRDAKREEELLEGLNKTKCPKCGDPVRNVEEDALCQKCI